MNPDAPLSPLPSPRAVEVVLHGPVGSVAQVRAWIEARSGFADSIAEDQPDGSVECRMTIVPPEE